MLVDPDPSEHVPPPLSSPLEHGSDKLETEACPSTTIGLRYWLCCRCLENPPEKYQHAFDVGGDDIIFRRLTSTVMRPVDKLVIRLARALPMDAKPSAGSQIPNSVIGRAASDLPSDALAALPAQQQATHYERKAGTSLGSPAKIRCQSFFSLYDTGVLGSSFCGLNASQCKPTDEWVSFRCPAWCASVQQRYINGHLIDKVIGTGPFRVDSRLCMAAMYAGHTNNQGGCFRARIEGPAALYEGGTKNGIKSIQFDSWYPLSLIVQADTKSSHCSFRFWPALLALSIVSLFVFALLRPSRRLFFWTMMAMGFWHCALISEGINIDVEKVAFYTGGFVTYIPLCYLGIWKLGQACNFFSDTAAGAPFHVVLLEVCPCYVMLHMHLLSYILGDYSLNLATFESTESLSFWIGVAVVVLPLASFLLWRWYVAGMLRSFVCSVIALSLFISGTTVLFAINDWGLHLHHYFLGGLGYWAARGNSRIAVVARGLCLGIFINGVVLWGRHLELTLWVAGEGWSPPTGHISTEASSTSSMEWASIESIVGERNILLSWARRDDIRANCSLPSHPAPSSTDIFVVEMNHVEVYRGPSRYSHFTLPLGASRFYFRVGVVEQGTVSGLSKVLAVRDVAPPVDNYYNQTTANACDRAIVLQSQPASSLENYV